MTMPLGYNLEYNVVAIGDTAPLNAYLVDDQGEMISSSSDPAPLTCLFNVQAPDGTRSPYQGTMNPDGSATLNYNDTTLAGHYVAVASFTMTDGTVKSTKTNFEVQDPFADPLINPLTGTDYVAQGVWHKIEDCFDSSDGGPWLREMTLRYFNPTKMADFINEAVMDFNLYQPPTTFTINDFINPTNLSDAVNPLSPLIIEGTFLAVIRHLMRSYVEQPGVQGAEFGWQDRRDYQERWKAIYEVELEMYKRWVSMAKRGQFGFGLTSQSLYSYSRGLFSPQFNRSRGFGFWGPGQ